MICYRDRTFCPFYETCKEGKRCSRSLTPRVKEHAEELGLPVCQYANKPECHKKKK